MAQARSSRAAPKTRRRSCVIKSTTTTGRLPSSDNVFGSSPKTPMSTLALAFRWFTRESSTRRSRSTASHCDSSPTTPKFTLPLLTRLRDLGKPYEAIAEYGVALRLNPDSAKTHTNLGNTLAAQGKLGEATAEHRTALPVRFEPDFAEAHCNLASALRSRQQGHFVEALAELQKGVTNWARRTQSGLHPSAEWVARPSAWSSLIASYQQFWPVRPSLQTPAKRSDSPGSAMRRNSTGLRPGFGPRRLMLNRSWPTTCRPRTATTPPAPPHWPARARARTTRPWMASEDPLAEPGHRLAEVRSDGVVKAPGHRPGAGAAIHPRDTPTLESRHRPGRPARRCRAAKLPADEQKACRALWAEVEALLAKIVPKPTP